MNLDAELYPEPTAAEMYRCDLRRMQGWQQKYDRMYRELPREQWFGKRRRRVA